jgi:caffeoyl-CoA O-methyltransferase
MDITHPLIEQYVKEHSSLESPVFKELAEKTRTSTSLPQMQVGHLEGSLLAFLIKISGAKNVLEIGTFTGYSTLRMAEALPEDGTIITLDKDESAVAIAKEFWDKSAHGRKIKSVIGNAAHSISTFPDIFDVVFIDADKSNYPHYVEACYPKLKPGGFFIIDNTLWGGAVLDPKEKRDRIIAELNDSLAKDARFEVVMLPIRDGVTIARKR